jgi:hypothetical protein
MGSSAIPRQSSKRKRSRSLNPSLSLTNRLGWLGTLSTFFFIVSEMIYFQEGVSLNPMSVLDLLIIADVIVIGITSIVLAIKYL